MFGFTELAVAQIVLLGLSILWFVRRNDEVPLLISGVLLYCSTYRFWAVTHNLGEWVRIWQFSLSPITEERALDALEYIVLGQAILLGTYMYRQKKVLIINDSVERPQLLNWLRPRIIALSLVAIPLVVLARYIAVALLRANRSPLETSSYLVLFPLALVGISVLNMSLWKTGGYRQLGYKAIASMILLYVAYLTFSPNLRFQFLGWIIGAAVIVSANYPWRKRVLAVAIAAFVGVGAFAVAGSLRDRPPTDQVDASHPAESLFTSAADANMLDGFVLLQEVYPEMLDYSWGGDHLEIFLRPIPRAFWPNKPVGGYANRLGFNDTGDPEVGLTGISPSIFGSFYAEGGLIGIVILSVVYGAGLAAIVSHTVHLRPFASLTIRALVCASLVPMLRGGDLAGIYGWIGMAYWPCFLLLWLKRKSLRMTLAPEVALAERRSLKTIYASFRMRRQFRKRLSN
jgi:hypothetical protein